MRSHCKTDAYTVVDAANTRRDSHASRIPYTVTGSNVASTRGTGMDPTVSFDISCLNRRYNNPFKCQIMFSNFFFLRVIKKIGYRFY